MICSPILPSCLDLRPGITSPPICTHAVVPPSLTMSRTLILVRVSCSHNKCTPCHLTSSLLPCLLAFKNRRLSKMILRIIIPLGFNAGVAATLRQYLRVSPMAPLIFHSLLPMQSFSGDQPDIDCVRFKAPSFSIACCQCSHCPGGSRMSIAQA